jgi:protein TonB
MAAVQLAAIFFARAGTLTIPGGVCSCTEGIMFRETLLESAPAMRRRSPWPVATAFTLEMMIASVLVLLPLISAGILPLATHIAPPLLAPTQFKAPENPRPSPSSGGGSGPVFRHFDVVPLTPSGEQLIDWNLHSRDTQTDRPWQPGIGTNDGPPSNLFENPQPIPPPEPPKRIIISHPSEAMLLNKVIPAYPAVARIAGVQGEVKLHAIIAKDGTIQSLAVTSGPEMLREAALKAVEQWRYRPYTLNGVPVEVETVITVSFHRF